MKRAQGVGVFADVRIIATRDKRRIQSFKADLKGNVGVL